MPQMFDSVCVRRTGIAEDEARLDLGLVAEALLFYGRVDIVADRSVFQALFASLGIDGFLRLVESERVSFSYCNQFTGVMTEDANTPTERFFLGVVEMPHTAIERLAVEDFRLATGKSGRGRRLAARFLNHVGDVGLDAGIHASATADALNADYVASLIRDVIGFMAPNYNLPEQFVFEIEAAEEERVKIRTNLDWSLVNRHWRAKSESQIGPSDVLGWILGANEEMAFAGHFASEMITNPFSARILRTKTEALLARERSADAQHDFQDLVFDEARSVREAVNSGQRSLLEALDLAERADRFRSWLSDLDEDHQLAREYLKACTAETWADSLPAKTVRFLTVTGASTAAGVALTGPIGIAAGPIIGTADFLQDVLRRGWRPSQFVERRLRGFVADRDR